MRVFKKSRGVEPIISALLLLVLTIFAFSITYMATTTWVSSQRVGPLLSLQERLVIEDVWFKTNATGKFICVYTRNVGKVDVEIYSMRVDRSVPPGIAPKKLFLEIRSGGWMNASFNWVVGTTYMVEVLTDRGSVMTTYAAA